MMWGDVMITAMLVIANGLGAGLLVPQVRHIRRTRTTAGISGAGVGIGIGLNVWWVAYATIAKAPGIVPASAVGVVLYLVIARTMWRAGNDVERRRLINATVVAVLAPLSAVITGGSGVLGLTLGIAYTVQFAPAAVDAATADDVSGISPTTWMMAAGEAAIWGVYGLLLRDAALIIGGLGGATMAVIVLANTWRPTTPVADVTVD